MGHHNQLEKFGKPYCPALYQLSGPGSEYSATETIRGIPYEFPSADRVVGREWTGQGEREAATRRFIEICREARYGGVPKGGGEANVLGFNRRDCFRNPHLRFFAPIFVRQLAECVVDMIVNRDDQLILLVSQWTGCVELLGYVLETAAIHPTCVAYGRETDCKFPLSAACIQGFSVNMAPAIGVARKVLEDAVLMTRTGIERDLVSAIVAIWRSCDEIKQFSPLQWCGVFVCAIDAAASGGDFLDLADGKKNGLAAMAARN